MDDLSKALGTIWPLIAIGALALGVVFALLRSSIAGVKAALDRLGNEQETLRLHIDEVGGQIEGFGERQSLLASRIAQAEGELANAVSLASTAAAVTQQQQQQQQRNDRSDDDLTICASDSLDRFNAAADALSLVARELEGFDSRQTENWLRIKGDLDEQAFQLQRVQQHVDRLFSAPQPSAAATAVSAAE